MNTGPSDEELREFVASMLSNLDRSLREPEVIEEAVRDHHDMWVMLYRASAEFDPREPPPQTVSD